MKTDMEIHHDVLAELAWDPRIGDKEIGVSTMDGVVTLTGSVSTYPERWAAERAAERVAGVKAVANDLVVKLASSLARTDTDIAHAIVDALAWDVEVPDTKIKSAVTNGWVTLEGDVEWRFQREAAARAVRSLTGVRGVTNNITVTSTSVVPADVSTSIKEALERRADRTAGHITVETRNGVVTLKGQVSSFADRRAAEGAAWAAHGVTDVNDELTVSL